MNRRITALAIMLATVLALTGGAIAGGLGYNPWSDVRSNDVIIKQTQCVDVFTKDKGDKNFKFSFCKPVEIVPGFWCIVFSTDVHSKYVGNFPYQHCWEETELTPAQKAYFHGKGLANSYFETNMGVDNPQDKK